MKQNGSFILVVRSYLKHLVDSMKFCTAVGVSLFSANVKWDEHFNRISISTQLIFFLLMKIIHNAV